MRVPIGKGQVQLLAVILLLASLASTFLHVYMYPLFAPAEVWGDHYFYWMQASTWLDLGEPLVLNSSVQEQLSSLYATAEYVNPGNDPAFQDPYAYRVLVPILAGLLGHSLGLNAAFLILGLASTLAVGFSCGLAVYKLTNSRVLSVGVAASAIWLPAPMMAEIISRYALVDMPSLAVVSAVACLLVFKKYDSAAVLAGFVAPLIRESLIPLAAVVAIYALLDGDFKKRYWFWALLPVLTYLVLERLIAVGIPNSPTTYLMIENPLRSAYLFIDVFGLVYLVAIGLVSRRVRPAAIALIPFVAFMFIIVSTLLSSPRHLLPLWPLILIFGSSGIWLTSRPVMRMSWTFLVVAIFVAAESHRLGLLPRESLFILIVAGFAWIFISLLGAEYPMRIVKRKGGDDHSRV